MTSFLNDSLNKKENALKNVSSFIGLKEKNWTNEGACSNTPLIFPLWFKQAFSNLWFPSLSFSFPLNIGPIAQ